MDTTIKSLVMELIQKGGGGGGVGSEGNGTGTDYSIKNWVTETAFV